MEANPNGWTTISLTFEEGSAEAVATINGSNKLLIGLDNVYRTTRRDGLGEEAARGHWEGGDSFVLDDHVLGTFLHWKLRVSFPGDELLIDAKEQVIGAGGVVRGRLVP